MRLLAYLIYRMLLWTIIGALLAMLWIWRVLDAFFGIRRIPDISSGTGAFDSAAEGRAAGSRHGDPFVTVIVPARNEAAHVEPALRSLMAQDYPRCEIIAVDDRSLDETGAILDRLASEAPERLRVLHVEKLPERWLGKTHAMWMAAQQARGDWLLFTDADVVFRPDTLRRAIAYAESAGVDHLVMPPRFRMHTVGERMMLAFFQIMFIFGHRPWKVADPRAKDHLGVGAFNLIRCSVYESLGTYIALRLAVLDDMKLGQLVKESGFRQRFVFGGDLLTLRWARGALGVVDNLTKNFFAIMQYKLWRSIGFTLLLVLFNVVPFVAVFVAPGMAKLGYVVAMAAIAGLYVGSSWHSEVRPQYFLLHPLSAVLFVYAMLRSVTLTLWHGGVVWRGTKYPLEELRREMV